MNDEDNKYVFLDRDGTLIVNKHYLCDPNEVELCDYAVEGLKILKSLGFKFVVVTNQSGIGRGYFKEAEMHRVHKRILELLEENDLFIEDFLFCPHSPKVQCACRKPEIGMLQNWAGIKNVDLKNSWMIGDRLCDVDFGINFSIRTAFITSGTLDDKEYKAAYSKADIVGESIDVIAQKIITSSLD